MPFQITFFRFFTPIDPASRQPGFQTAQLKTSSAFNPPGLPQQRFVGDRSAGFGLADELIAGSPQHHRHLL